MAIDSAGWFDWMIKDPGPLNKTNGGRNTVRGVVPHSAEGYWPHLQELLHSQARRASWAFSNLRDGRCFQHYSIYAQTWTSGAAYPNNNFVAWENEGVAGQPFTAKQTDNCVRIIDELSAVGNWEPERPTKAGDMGATCYEHNECVRWGALPTACPSGRVPWAEILSRTGGAMTPEELKRLENLERQVYATRVDLNTFANATEQASALNKMAEHKDGKHQHPWWTPKGIYFIGQKTWPF